MRGSRGKRGNASEKNGAAQDRWLLSYADFVTLLLAVFIVLFAFSRKQNQSIHSVSVGIHSGFDALSLRPPSKAVGGETANRNLNQKSSDKSIASPLQQGELKSQLENILGDAINKRQIVVQQTSEGLTISMQDFGFFDSGNAELLPGAAAQIRRIAQVLIQHNLEVRVEGHSDDQPIHTASFHSNWELSTARAMSVLTLLIEDAGFPPTMISVAGYGPYRPVAENFTAEGRRMNRRVDLVILEPKSKLD